MGEPKFYAITSESVEFPGFMSYGYVFMREPEDEIQVLEIIEPLMHDYIGGHITEEDAEDAGMDYDEALSSSTNFTEIDSSEYLKGIKHTRVVGTTKSGAVVYFDID